MTDKQTVTIQGKDYVEEDLPLEIRQLISINKTWNKDLVDAKLEVSKVEAALRELAREIVDKITAIESQAIAAKEAADATDGAANDEG